MRKKQIFSYLVVGIGFLFLFIFCFANNKPEKQLPKSDLNSDLQELINTEKSFAATAVKEGFRDSFIKFFAEDGIGFGPKPERTREVLLKTPSETEPSPTIFNWQPMFGDISLAGDMGYTTGPLLFTSRIPNAKPPSHGLYFSVWQKQPDKSWKVVVDMGVGVPAAVAPLDVGFTSAKNSDGITKSQIKNLTDGNFNDLDAEFTTDIKKSGFLDAYNHWLPSEFRIHRSGVMPILNKESLSKYFEGRSVTMSFERLGGKISQSKDLGFTYGSFQATVVKDGKETKPAGYYVHVWRRNKLGQWKLVADIIN